MKAIILAASLALAGCATIPANIPTAPVEVADSTKIDELAAMGAEVAYTTASTLGNSLSRAGMIDRPRFQALDRQAYGYLLAVRAAYRAGNSGSLAEALANLNVAVSQIRDLGKD